MGEGSCVHFWLEDWVRVGPLSMSFLAVFGLVVNKCALVKDFGFLILHPFQLKVVLCS